jgi:hypothetical protein
MLYRNVSKKNENFKEGLFNY